MPAREEFDRWWDAATQVEREIAIADEVLHLDPSPGYGEPSWQTPCRRWPNGTVGQIPPLTVDVAAAWEVIRWIETHDMTWWELSRGGPGYCFAIHNDGESALLSAYAEGVTEAEAICKATLMSVRGI